jgi:hypothetical protein
LINAAVLPCWTFDCGALWRRHASLTKHKQVVCGRIHGFFDASQHEFSMCEAAAAIPRVCHCELLQAAHGMLSKRLIIIIMLPIKP